MDKKPVSCIGCLYYYVTWDKKYPKGCKLFGFKGMEMPCITVLKNSGLPCTSYTRRNQPS